jgi:hypothetical protein
MALHSIPEAKARVALARVATRLQVPVTAVAQAVLVDCLFDPANYFDIQIGGTGQPVTGHAGAYEHGRGGA